MLATSYWFWQRPSWGWSEFWALLLVLLLAFAIHRNGKSFFYSLILGVDKRWSTSKASATLWTFGLLFVFFVIAFHTGGHGLDHLKLDQQYILLLGIPAGAAVAARAIKQSKTGGVPPADRPQPTVVQGLGQLLSDDDGNADLLDSQYFLFSVLLMGYFLLQFMTGESTTLPTLPNTLVGLTGVSAVAYTAKKGTEQPLRER